VETATQRIPPPVERKPAGNRLGFAIGGGVIAVAVFVGSFVMQPGRNAGAGDSAAAAATPSSPPAASTAAATSGSSSNPSGAIAPRDAAAPPVAPGKNSTLADARPLALAVAEAGEILTIEDTRFYKVDNALKLRDLALIRLQNESATLRPNLKVLNADKSLMAEPYDPSPGASLQAHRDAQPRGAAVSAGHGLRVNRQIQDLSDAAKGVRRIRAERRLAHTGGGTGRPDINAGILDDKDHDSYRVSGASKTSGNVTFENLSTTLRPDLKVFDRNKSMIVEKYDGRPGRT
jgi:hypothetical protein